MQPTENLTELSANESAMISKRYLFTETNV
jgi:hypothetical protein